MTDAAERIIDLYRRHGATWAALRGNTLREERWLAQFAALLAPRATVLDIGCGSGEPIARYFVDHCFSVHGVDSSAEMIALFERNHADSTAIVADMRTLHIGRTFGGVIAWDSFFHLTPDDQRGMFPIFAEHLDTGGPLLFTSGPCLGEAIGSLEGEPLYHASLDPGEYRSLLDASGFEVVAHVAEDPDCGKHTIWLARRR